MLWDGVGGGKLPKHGGNEKKFFNYRFQIRENFGHHRMLFFLKSERAVSSRSIVPFSFLSFEYLGVSDFVSLESSRRIISIFFPINFLSSGIFRVSDSTVTFSFIASMVVLCNVRIFIKSMANIWKKFRISS